MIEAQQPSAEVSDAREVLKERARALARPAAELAESASRSFVVFSLGDERYAIETCCVFGVSRVGELFALPGAGSHVLGLTSFQGELLVLFDLRVLMGSARPARTDATRMMVLGQKQPELAVLADSVHDVQPLDDRELLPLPAAAADGDRSCVCAVTREAVSVFDAGALLSDPRLFVEESGTGPLP